jgi:hypothetical protein
MSAGSKFKQWAGVVLLCAPVWVGTVHATDTAPAQHHKKTAKKPDLPTLPSGPTGRAVPQMPLDSIKPIMPTVTFQNGELTIAAPNSTLGDILRAVRKQTGAEIEIPEAQERVVTQLGPGPARAVVAELLNGSRFNYVLLGSPQDANVLTRVVLVAKSGPDNPPPAPGAPAGAAQAQAAPPPAAPENQDANDADTPLDDASAQDDAAAAEQQQQQAAEAEQQPAADQNGVKTPQQMLQEMQQRQMQFQQQQQGGTQQQPGQGYPQRPTLPGQQPQMPPDQNQNQ